MRLFRSATSLTASVAHREAGFRRDRSLLGVHHRRARDGLRLAIQTFNMLPADGGQTWPSAWSPAPGALLSCYFAGIRSGRWAGFRGSLVAGHRRPMLQMPTGAGKTLLAAHVTRRTLDKGKRVAFVVPALSLIDQTVTALEAGGVASSASCKEFAERTDRDQPVQVCSIQTIGNASVRMWISSSWTRHTSSTGKSSDG